MHACAYVHLVAAGQDGSVQLGTHALLACMLRRLLRWCVGCTGAMGRNHVVAPDEDDSGTPCVQGLQTATIWGFAPSSHVSA